jgi:hypothetical protein
MNTCSESVEQYGLWKDSFKEMKNSRTAGSFGEDLMPGIRVYIQTGVFVDATGRIVNGSLPKLLYEMRQERYENFPGSKTVK